MAQITATTPNCTIPNCPYPMLVPQRGWCNRHYLRWQRHGDPNWVRPQRVARVCSVENCGRKLESSDLCKKHYYRLISHGDPTLGAKKKHSTLDRLWPKVNKTETCWLWSGCISSGYGVMANYGDVVSTSRQVHRIVYEKIHGKIPDGLVLDHLCRVRRCCNPEHLEVVTDEVNILRGVGASALNIRKTHCPRGHVYSPENTDRDKLGHRHCIACRKEKYHEKKALTALTTELVQP